MGRQPKGGRIEYKSLPVFTLVCNEKRMVKFQMVYKTRRKRIVLQSPNQKWFKVNEW